jgi:hypothetical protein
MRRRGPDIAGKAPHSNTERHGHSGLMVGEAGEEDLGDDRADRVVLEHPKEPADLSSPKCN